MKKKTDGNISSNAILRQIARNKKVDELAIELKVRKNARGYETKLGLYVAESDVIFNYCSKRRKYIKDEAVSTFETVRQWGLHAIDAKNPKQLSVKSVVYVDDNTIAWHEANGIGEQLRRRAPAETFQKTFQKESSDEFVLAMGSTKMTAYNKMNNEAKMGAVRYQIQRSNDRNMFSTIKTLAIEGERLIEIRKQEQKSEMLKVKEVIIIMHHRFTNYYY